MAKYKEFHARSITNPSGFWAEEAALIDWKTPFKQVLDYSRPPFAKWFVGGTTNICHNAVDCHLASRGDQPALIYVSTEGVTGTNGKTSVTHWIAQALTQLGRKTTVIGTIGNGFPGALTPSLNTTPDGIELQQRLAYYRQQGATACAMEVSSHGLAQGRVNGTSFNVAVLTNLSRDHLDYHGDIERYAEAKAQLFNWAGLEWSVLNVDDEFGRQLERGARPGRVAGYGFERGAVVGQKLSLTQNGLHLRVHTDWGDAEIEAPLLGRFNAANLLAVLATLLVSDAKLDHACKALASHLQVLLPQAPCRHQLSFWRESLRQAEMLFGAVLEGSFR